MKWDTQIRLENRGSDTKQIAFKVHVLYNDIHIIRSGSQNDMKDLSQDCNDYLYKDCVLVIPR